MIKSRGRSGNILILSAVVYAPPTGARVLSLRANLGFNTLQHTHCHHCLPSVPVGCIPRESRKTMKFYFRLSASTTYSPSRTLDECRSRSLPLGPTGERSRTPSRSISIPFPCAHIRPSGIGKSLPDCRLLVSTSLTASTSLTSPSISRIRIACSEVPSSGGMRADSACRRCRVDGDTDGCG